MTTPHDAAQFTVQQAAEALGASVRTIRRRLANGDIPSHKVQRGERLVTVIDGGDLAAYAQANGVALRGTEGNGTGHDGDTEGHAAPIATEQTEGNGQGTESNAVAAGAEVAQLREQLRAMTQERDWLRGHVDALTRALPPAPEAAPGEPQRRPWWCFWRE